MQESFEDYSVFDENFVNIMFTVIVFLPLSSIPTLTFFISNSAGVSRKAEDANPTGASGPCSKF